MNSNASSTSIKIFFEVLSEPISGYYVTQIVFGKMPQHLVPSLELGVELTHVGQENISFM